MQINNMMGISDSDFLQGVNEKDERMFSRFFNLYYAASVNQAYALISNKEEARQIVQDIFQDVWSGTARFDTLVKAKSFLYVSVRNRCYNYLKRKEPFTYVDISQLADEIQPVTDEALWEYDYLQSIYEELNNLPPEQQKVMYLFLDGYSDEQIADELGKSYYTVRNTKINAINKLRVIFGNTKRAVIFCWLLINAVSMELA